MTRPPRSPGKSVLVVCSDLFHCGDPGHARYGHVLLGTIGILPAGPDGSGRLHWSGRLAESAATLRGEGVNLHWPGIAPRLPVKQYRRPDGSRVWRFFCPCGRTPEPTEEELTGIIARHREAKPGERVVIDIVRLERARDHL